MKKVIVILIGFLPNPRIYKRIELEKTLGELHLICWDKGNSMLSRPEGNEYSVHIVDIPAGGDPIRRMVPYMRFAQEANRLLNEIQPDLIHVQGLDMLKIAGKYKKQSGRDVRIIYEVADLHRLLIDKQKNPLKKAIQWYLQREDRRLEKNYQLLLLTSMKFYELYFESFVSKDKILYMPNVPDLSAFSAFQKKNDHSDFTVGYIGSIRYKQQMRNLLEAAKECGIKLLIAGFECEPIEIEPLCRDNPDIEWVGRFDFDKQAAALYGKCDAMYSVYDADMQNVRVALPNKLYEAVYCEIPLIVAKNTYLAQLVDEWGVGLAVDHKNKDELVEALRRLQSDQAFGRCIEQNCRRRKNEVDLNLYNQQLEKKVRELLS